MDQFNELITSGRLTELLLPWGIKIGLAALIFLAGRWIAKMAANSVDKIMEKAGVDATLTHFLHNVIYAALLIAVTCWKTSRRAWKMAVAASPTRNKTCTYTRLESNLDTGDGP